MNDNFNRHMFEKLFKSRMPLWKKYCGVFGSWMESLQGSAVKGKGKDIPVLK
jgi:hypothetical protein